MFSASWAAAISFCPSSRHFHLTCHGLSMTLSLHRGHVWNRANTRVNQQRERERVPPKIECRDWRCCFWSIAWDSHKRTQFSLTGPVNLSNFECLIIKKIFQFILDSVIGFKLDMEVSIKFKGCGSVKVDQVFLSGINSAFEGWEKSANVGVSHARP